MTTVITQAIGSDTVITQAIGSDTVITYAIGSDTVTVPLISWLLSFVKDMCDHPYELTLSYVVPSLPTLADPVD